MHILLICGGKSSEREVSLRSAQFFIKHLKYKFHVLIIDEENNCELQDQSGYKVAESTFGAIEIIKAAQTFLGKITDYKFTFDIVLPILHGKFGEDGTIQGWLELLGVPYVGCRVLASALCLDKDMSKRLVEQAGIKTADYYTVYKGDPIPTDIDYPVFVKAANSGSSIGVYKVTDPEHLPEAVHNAFNYDNKVIIEQSIEKAREIEVAVLQSDELIVSIPGEVIVKNHDFYSYEAKYLDADSTTLAIPARLSNQQTSQLQAAAKIIFQTLNCSGMARIDFLLQNEEIFFNEVNTIPGFTEISLYPNLLKASGVEYSQLVEILIASAFRK